MSQIASALDTFRLQNQWDRINSPLLPPSLASPHPPRPSFFLQKNQPTVYYKSRASHSPTATWCSMPRRSSVRRRPSPRRSVWTSKWRYRRSALRVQRVATAEIVAKGKSGLRPTSAIFAENDFRKSGICNCISSRIRERSLTFAASVPRPSHGRIFLKNTKLRFIQTSVHCTFYPHLLALQFRCLNRPPLPRTLPACLDALPPNPQN